MRPARWLLALPLLLIASTASADPGTAASASEEERDYAYDFDDDPLTANQSVAQGAVLRLRTQIVRRTLIRPRAHFIPEMLKSVEQI